MVLAEFAGKKLIAIEKYKQFVSDVKKQPSPWEQLKNKIYLGNEKIVRSMQSRIERDKELFDINYQVSG